jgi:hypothetical protein
MHENALNMVDLEGTPNALPVLRRSHHEMFHEELAATVEQLHKFHLALRRIEYVRLLDFHPRKRRPFCAQLIAKFRELSLEAPYGRRAIHSPTQFYVVSLFFSLTINHKIPP